jgi:hypothetical protein
MKLVSCNKFHPINFLLINTQEKYEIFAVVKMTMLFFWVVTSCRLRGRYQRFGETFSPSSGLKMAAFPSKLKLWETVRLSFVLQQLRNNRFI